MLEQTEFEKELDIRQWCVIIIALDFVFLFV
jgi:hypothetical protein